MKKFLLFLLSISTLFLEAKPIQEREIDPEALSELALELGIAPSDNLIEKTQEQWLRKSGQERWEQVEIDPAKRQFVLDWTKEQGLLSDWVPALRAYDKALILGATTSRMQARLDYLTQLWRQGVRFEEIVWLTGDRPLDPRVDGLLDRCSNESEAARIVWEEAELPEGMREISVVFVAVPMRGTIRPTTADTIYAWLETAPPPCSALFVSDQPFCGYQFAVVKSILPERFEFDLIGHGADPSSHPAAAAIILDSIARWIYQER